MNTYVLSIIGADRAGLVEALAKVVAEHGGSWERSHLAELAGMFAGMVQVRVPPEKAEAFRSSLEPLREQGLLDVALRPATDDASDEDPETVAFEVVGSDRPGIVHEVSARLASLGVGIVELRTWTESAAMAGTPLFRAAAVVRLIEGVEPHHVELALEDLSDDLMVDLVQDV